MKNTNNSYIGHPLRNHCGVAQEYIVSARKDLSIQLMRVVLSYLQKRLTQLGREPAMTPWNCILDMIKIRARQGFEE